MVLDGMTTCGMVPARHGCGGCGTRWVQSACDGRAWRNKGGGGHGDCTVGGGGGSGAGQGGDDDGGGEGAKQSDTPNLRTSPLRYYPSAEFLCEKKVNL